MFLFYPILSSLLIIFFFSNCNIIQIEFSLRVKLGTSYKLESYDATKGKAHYQFFLSVVKPRTHNLSTYLSWDLMYLRFQYDCRYKT